MYIYLSIYLSISTASTPLEDYVQVRVIALLVEEMLLKIKKSSHKFVSWSGIKDVHASCSGKHKHRLMSEPLWIHTNRYHSISYLMLTFQSRI